MFVLLDPREQLQLCLSPGLLRHSGPLRRPLTPAGHAGEIQ
jgi:hypothetical protein